MVRSGHRERHYGGRSGWLRAAVLGADDGLVSTASLMLGVAASSASRAAVLTAGLAGLVAGATSMAAGEFVSVSSQKDAELEDLSVEAAELATDPDAELDELTGIYIGRGLNPRLAREVAVEFSRTDPLAAHARDELGHSPDNAARPVQAAGASALSFAAGAVLPLVAMLAGSGTDRVVLLIAVTEVGLGLLGAVGAALGGANRVRAAVRVVLGGSVAMAVTAAVGALVGTTVG
ncbi:VIT1/CCC1 transporter family protein [Protofrankia symbiont of Coriaria ruscifolia]|uniref:VIT1/CCC1 transporter family protein n=1 Tax=Protofrankia symbiont of Coriaria ruscifolia TaxID=1306542 RepID=UPI0010413741|nr:VIT family protein [Protofrankia symbiont of Coriaria ruscifolia]